MAKKFRFNLEIVRKLRERERDAQRREVGNAVRAVTDVQKRIENLTASLRDTVALGRDEQSEARLDVGLLQGQRFHQSWLHGEILESSGELREKQRRLEAERDKLGRANARLKAIEQLRERRWRDHQLALLREERAMFDETALQMFARSRHSMRVKSGGSRRAVGA